jgi:ArsR family transcriptional regulator
MLQKDERIYSLQASLCKALSNPIRLMIIDVLREGEATVSDLQEKLDRQQSNLSQHLAVLRGTGLVESRRDGTKVLYSLTSQKIVEACSLVRTILRDQSEQLGNVVNRS